MAQSSISHEAAVRFTDSLERTQYYSKERMQAYQRNLLTPLLHHARKHVPFYQHRLEPLFGEGDEIRWEAWKDVPTFTRDDAQNAADGLFSRSLPQEMGNFYEGETSGSTGTPLKFRTTDFWGILVHALSERTLRWHNVNTDADIGIIMDSKGKFPAPEGALGQRWNLRNPEARAFQLSLSENIGNQLDWIMRFKPQILMTYPSIANAIAQLAHENGLKLPIHTLIAQGETIPETTHANLTAQHGIKIIDRYGTSELGPISVRCPLGSGHHQFQEAALCEVLDLDGPTEITDGRGRLILTPFYNYAMPLIRYENQDQVLVSSKTCVCGRHLPVLEDILGRERHVFIYEDGSRSWPYMKLHHFGQYLPAKQLQIVQKTHRDIEVRFVRDDSGRETDKDNLEKMMRHLLHPSISISLIEAQHIPRNSSGKFENWITEVAC